MRLFRRPRPSFVPLILPAVLAACSEPDAEPAPEDASPAAVAPAVQVEDSAGVVVRRSPASALERIAYDVVPDPAVLIDGSEGGGQPLHAVGALAFGPEGRIAIAERGEMGVRMHAANGARLRVIGREGQGPGEFGALNGVGFRADSMFVFDSRWFRISVFDPAGEYVRQVVPESAWGARPRWYAFAPGGGILTTSRGAAADLVWGMHGFDGAPIRSFADAPSPAAPRMALMVPSSAHAGPSEPLPLFVAQPVAGPWRDGMVVTSGRDYRLEFRDASGAVTEVWSVSDAVPPSVTDAHVSAARRRALASTDPEQRPLVERRWSNVDPAERFPAFGAPSGIVFTDSPQMLEAEDGALWVRAFPAPPVGDEAEAGPRWWVFGADGALLGAVDFPPRFELHAVGDAGALGILEDEWDVQRVAVFALAAPTDP